MDRSELEFGEQLRLLHRHAPVVYAGTLIVSALAVLALRDFVEFRSLIGWAAAVWVLGLVRVTISHIAAYPRDGFRSPTAWRWYFVVGAGLSGALWGFGGVFFFVPENPLIVAFVLIVLAGMTAGSLASLSAYAPTYVAYAVPTMIPIGIRLLMEGGSVNTVLGFFCLIFLLVNLVYSRNIQKTILESIRLRFRNLDLVENLEQQKIHAEAARMEAEHANLAKSRFLAAASHDLRQPVHALGLLVEALDNVDDETERSELQTKIRQSMDVLRDLFNALLDISKLDAGVIEYEVLNVDLREIAQRLDREIRPRAEKKDLALKWTGMNRTVRSDPVLLERILRNLVQNAIDFTSKGSVDIVAGTENEDVSIEVHDTGPGIDAEDHERIFGEFTQLSNPERDRRKGLGLGLAIVRRLCALLGHRLTLSSVPGQGSVFRIELPQGSPEGSRTAAVDAREPAWSVEGRCVLVIDDEEGILAATRAVLQGWGCQALCAESGDDAVALLEQDTVVPDLILADYRLRGQETGVDAIASVRAYFDGRQIPALLMTGDTAKERVSEALSSGFRLLHKPVQPAQLRMAVNRMLTAVRRPARPVG